MGRSVKAYYKEETTWDLEECWQLGQGSWTGRGKQAVLEMDGESEFISQIAFERAPTLTAASI